MKEKAYIQIDHLTKKIKNKSILNDLSLSIQKGERCFVVGHNGSGKTMLLRAIAGLLKINKNAIRINGKEVNFSLPRPEHIGVIIENPTFINEYTGFENLMYLAQINEMITEKEVLQVLEEVGLTEQKDKKVKAYSLGMKQRLAIAQAYMEHQPLLLFDEPTNGLDRTAYEQFKSLCEKWKAEERTVIIATHDQLLAKELAEKVYYLSDGVLAKDPLYEK